MLQQGLALELDQNINRIDARVNQITEYEIHDPVSTPEGNGRLRPLLGKRVEARALTSGQHKCEHAHLHFMSLRFKCSDHAHSGRKASHRETVKVVSALLHRRLRD